MDSITSRQGTIGSDSFREYVNSYLYVESEWLVNKYRHDLSIRSEDKGFVMMCYIDLEEGLCFDVFCAAHVEYGNIKCDQTYADTHFTLHFATLEGMHYRVLAGLPYRKTFIKKRDAVMKHYDAPEQKALQEVRKIRELDSSRHPAHPDDVHVTLYKEGCELEFVWVKCLRMEKGTVFCRLMSEPEQDFGVHQGAEVRMNLLSFTDGEPAFWGCWVK